MLRCNGADTGCNITGRESEPTSDGSFVAREFDEPPERENADGGGSRGPLVRSLSPQGVRWLQASIAKVEEEYRLSRVM